MSVHTPNQPRADHLRRRLPRSPGLAVAAIALAVLLLPSTGLALVYEVHKEVALYGNLNQHNIHWQPLMACGPVAVTNSLWYLQNKYPGVYDTRLVPQQQVDQDGNGVVNSYDDLIAVADNLGQNFMFTDPANGTWHDNLIVGKMNYIEGRLPGQTVYEAQDQWGWAHQTRPNWVQPVTPGWDFMFGELKDCEDVEILLSRFNDGGHYLTVTGFTWNDANNDKFIDPSENARIEYMDPWTGATGNSHVWNNGSPGSPGEMETDYFTDGSWISVVVSESPSRIPEPCSLIVWSLLAVLGIALGWWRKRKA